MQIISRVTRSLRSRIARTLWEKKLVWLSYDHPGDFSSAGHHVTLRRFDFSMRKNSFEYLLDGYPFLLNLSQTAGVTLTPAEHAPNTAVNIAIQELNFCISSYDELFILNEVFAEGIYDVLPPGKGMFSVVDIGMNVGITALHLAANERVEKVYAFEPFSATYAQALENITANAHLASKIECFNVGLGANERRIEVEYDPEQKGKMGIHGVARTGEPASKNTTLETIDIRPAGRTLNALLVDGTWALLKVDCEGAEYEIFEDLLHSDTLAKFNAVVVEWHHLGHEPLRKALHAAGFTTHCSNPNNRVVGVLYGFK